MIVSPSSESLPLYREIEGNGIERSSHVVIA